MDRTQGRFINPKGELPALFIPVSLLPPDIIRFSDILEEIELLGDACLNCRTFFYKETIEETEEKKPRTTDTGTWSGGSGSIYIPISVTIEEIYRKVKIVTRDCLTCWYSHDYLIHGEWEKRTIALKPYINNSTGTSTNWSYNMNSTETSSNNIFIKGNSGTR